ncbi:hypothetical protein, variant [Aphanomyces invadans]|uniref:FH2 domain-containing protein n=1 Tax=Aphanomyces invadans TaxID=157072 RepID=A0A024TUH9_9STRA|nr:hypothetical protein, variant [Aphanomyces invadans]ETV96972.1 hypothetical protein, variant [Aphanomyces invadans]|eukprot:XP_008874218.1 hypothetical protein, variant [Aphanomyces invadans]
MNPFRRWSGRQSKKSPKHRKDSFTLESPPSLSHEILEREPSLVVSPTLTRPSEPSQIDALFRDMMDKMPLSNAAADRMWALPIHQKWQLVQEWSKKHEHERQHDHEHRQPIFWVQKLQAVALDTGGGATSLTEDEARGLHVLMRGASKEWLHKFHRHGGVTSLCNYMAALAFRAADMADPTFTFDNAVLLECLRCYKTLMTNPFGLELLLDSTDHHIDTLAQCLDFSNYSQQHVTMMVLEMLSVFCWHSERGQVAVVQAMGSYQRTHKERARFASLVQCLTSSDSTDLHAACLTFINTIVGASPCLEDRVHVRNDFLALDMLVVCHVIQAKLEPPPSPPRFGSMSPSQEEQFKPPSAKAFVKQLRVFEGFMVSDMEETVTHNVDLTNVDAVFGQLKAWTSRYGFSDRLLNVLLALMGIPGEATMGTKMWELMEEAVLQITSLHTYQDLAGAPRQISFEWVRDLQDSVELFQSKVDTIATLESTVAALEAQSKRCHATVKAREHEIAELKSALDYVYAERLKHQSIVCESTQTWVPTTVAAVQTDRLYGCEAVETQTDDMLLPTSKDSHYDLNLKRLRDGTAARDDMEAKMRAEGLNPADLVRAEYGSQPSIPPPLAPSLTMDPKVDKYFKLMKMGMLKEHVLLKMTAEGLNPLLLDAPPATPQQSVTEAQPLQQQLPLAHSSPTPTHVNVEKSVKLLEVGMPKDQVSLKMRADKLDPALLDQTPPPLPDLSTTSTAIDPKYEKYTKLVKMGMPEGQVLMKMKADGVDSSGFQVPSAAPPVLTNALPIVRAAPLAPAVDPKHEKYLTLLKMGMPTEQVALKMKADGLDSSVLNPLPRSISSPTSDASSSILLPPREELAPLDPQYNKFVKLLQMGMPLEQIQVKVKAEGLDPSKLTVAFARPSLTSSSAAPDVCECSKPPASSPPVPSPPSFKLPAKVSTVPRVKLRSLYWTPLADAAVEGSIWLNLDETKLGLDYTLLDKEFGQDKKANDPAVTSSTKSGSGNGTTLGKPKTVHLVDSKRQQNCSIALSRFRMAPKDIKAAIVALDDKLLTLERIQSLAAMVPTPEELDLVKGYEGDVAVLGETEKFFLAISDLPRLSNRLKAMEATLTFGQRYDDVKGKLKLLEQAYVDLKGSTKLLSLLEVVLAVGNYLNRGTSRGGAYGFKLDILPKLTQVKATTSPNKTLLHVIADYVAANVPAAHDFYESLRSLEDVSAISFTLLQSDIHVIEASLLQIEQEVAWHVVAWRDRRSYV